MIVEEDRNSSPNRARQVLLFRVSTPGHQTLCARESSNNLLLHNLLQACRRGIPCGVLELAGVLVELRIELAAIRCVEVLEVDRVTQVSVRAEIRSTRRRLKHLVVADCGLVELLLHVEIVDRKRIEILLVDITYARAEAVACLKFWQPLPS